MRLHDYTGFEGLSDIELVSEALRRYDPLVSSPIELEMAQRLDQVEENEPLLRAYEKATSDWPVNEVSEVFETLSRHDIDRPEQLDEALGLASVITEYDVTKAELATILRKHFETKGEEA